ncbi:MAG: MerR family DNA-binding transcriptional regulator [Alphaproteobacteria bacterium]|nr:MerR family DNA-binding transcriptional regulator [Alphaproteobacteria bacterium]
MYEIKSGYLSAAAAARTLGVTPATLYAYVSRGLIRSERAAGRTRRYHAGDVADLTRGRAPVGPVLPTAITLARDGQIFFRGRDAVELARTLSVREAAALIWDCDPAASFAADNVPDPLPGGGALHAALVALPPPARMLALLQVATAAEPRWPDAAAFFGYAGARLLRFLAAAAAGVAPSARPIDAVLAEAWSLGRDSRPLLRAGLILAADNGIDAAALATRAAAAAGVPPWQSVAAGLAALDFGADNGTDARADALIAMLPRAPRAPRPSRTLAAALAALGDALGLPRGGAAALYGIGRAIGLVAHLAEERTAQRPFRARGVYVGVTPEITPIPQSGRG